MLKRVFGSPLRALPVSTTILVSCHHSSCALASGQLQRTSTVFNIPQRCLSSNSACHGLPTFALIGRPNVGKSTMFNRLVGRKVALVYDTPGSHVTRDYKEREAILLDLRFKLIDTSGLEPFMSCTTIQGRATAITQRVCSSHCNAVHNPQRLMAQATASLLLVDCRNGVTAADADIASWLRRHHRGRVVVIAAKCDSYNDTALICAVHEVSALGLGEAVPYSAETKAGTVELYNALRPLVDAYHSGLNSAPTSDAPGGGSRDALQSESQHVSVRTDGPSNCKGRTNIRGKRSAMNFGGWSPHRAETTSLSGSTTASSTEPMERDSDKVKGQQVLNGALSPKPERAMSLANPRDLGADTAASSLHSQCSDSEGMERPTVLAESASDLDDAMRTLSNRDTGAITKRRRKKAVRTQILSANSSDVLGKQAPIKLAIVGLPNTGKSTLLNTLLGYERVVTGPEPGLTRDAVTSSFSWGDLKFEIADTAGWVREGVLQKYDEVGGKLAGLTVLQGKAKMNFSHVVLLLVDGYGAICRFEEKGVEHSRILTRRELDLAGTILEEGRMLVIAPNKLDLLNQQQRHALVMALQEQINSNLASWRDCIEIKPLTGKTGKGMDAILKYIADGVSRWDTYIPTRTLNAWRYKLSQEPNSSPPLTSLKFLKMVATRPPTLLAEWRPKAANKSYPAAVARAVRQNFGLQGVPVRVLPLSKERRPQPQSRRKGTRQRARSRASRASGRPKNRAARPVRSASAGHSTLQDVPRVDKGSSEPAKTVDKAPPRMARTSRQVPGRAQKKTVRAQANKTQSQRVKSTMMPPPKKRRRRLPPSLAL